MAGPPPPPGHSSEARFSKVSHALDHQDLVSSFLSHHEREVRSSRDAQMVFQEGGQRLACSRAVTLAFLFEGVLSPLGGTPRDSCLLGTGSQIPMPSGCLARQSWDSPSPWSRGRAGRNGRMAQRWLSSVWVGPCTCSNSPKPGQDYQGGGKRRPGHKR